MDLKLSFNNLEPDIYYNENRGRAFSLLNIKNTDNISIIGDINFYQSKTYNNYNGDIIRNYKNIDTSILNDTTFKYYIKTFKKQIEEATTNLVEDYNADYTDHIFVHQIRVYGCKDTIINPVPEGIHRDGYNIIGLSIVDRENIEGGISKVYDNDNKLIFTKQLDVGEMLIINDNKMYHSVTPIKLDKQDKKGYRDIFVFTTIS